MVWVWVVALLGTLVGFALAWRALARADAALVTAHLADPSGELTAATQLVAVEVDLTADRHDHLQARSGEQGS